MNLSDREKELIARRAGGEYAIIPTIRNILTKHQKNRNPEDAPFLDFARLVLRKTIPWDEYMSQAKIVLDLYPEPFGPPWNKQGLEGPIPGPYPESEAPKKKTKKKRQRKCGICSEPGHNARTCPQKPATPTMTSDDGIERLTPGFDPNGGSS